MYYSIDWTGTDGKRYSADYETEAEALADWEEIRKAGNKRMVIEPKEGTLLPKPKG